MDMANRLIEWLAQPTVRLMDGAMGTQLQRAGLAVGERGEAWNVQHPELVLAVHQAYVQAGAEVLLTNSFQANPLTQPERLDEVLSAAVRLARKAAGDGRLVLLDVGPMAGPEHGEFGDGQVWERLAAAASCCDGLLIETCSTEHALAAVRRARGLGRPVLLSFWYRFDGGEFHSVDGHSPEWFAERAEAVGIAALGVNCGVDLGVAECAEIVKHYRQATRLPIFARPNAGTPQRQGERWSYPRSPDAMAVALPLLLEAGVRMIGGCCGTTPEHLAAFRRVVDEWNQMRQQAASS